MTMTPNGAGLYVSDYNANAVTPIVTATGKAGPAINVSPAPCALAITPNGKRVYVAHNPADLSGHTVTPISTATNKAGKDINVGLAPVFIAITP